MIKTLTFHTDTPSDRKLMITLPTDVPEGPLDIVLVIAAADKPAATVDTTGRWQKYFPSDFDLDGALAEIRREWEHEWPDAEQ